MLARCYGYNETLSGRQPGAAVIDPACRALLDRWVYVLVLTGGEFVAPYTVARRERLRAGGEYEPDFFPFLERFLSALAAPDWPAGNYFPGGWYRTLKTQGRALSQVPMDVATLGPYFGEDVHVDPLGRWRVGPKPVTDRVLRFFLQHLHFDLELARYFICYANVNYPETRYLRHESPPYRVRAIAFDRAAPAVRLNDGTTEPLRVKTLRMNGQEALFCAIKPDGLPAILEDPARFQVLDRVEAHGGGMALRVGGGLIPVTLDAPWAGADRLPGD
jgi:hypothetical protein